MIFCGYNRKNSYFELRNKTHEPLTGRKWEYQLFPISWQEFETHVGYLAAEQQLETRLIYGFYPEVINQMGQERFPLFFGYLAIASVISGPMGFTPDG
jgi:predicted AAA+ superfamily ATPase